MASFLITVNFIIKVLQKWSAIFCVSFSQERKSEIFFYEIPSLVCTQLFSKNLAAPVQGLSVSFPPAKLHCILQDFKVVSIPLSKSMMISDARPLLCTDAGSSNAAGISGSGGMTFLQVFLSTYNVHSVLQRN